MDKITDHLFIFEGNGVVKDFRGTYQDHKTAELLEGGKMEKNPPSFPPSSRGHLD
jgi:ATP-binding cassette subfamily F protein uup